MNRVYKVIWSKAKHCYVVTSEIARSVTKSASSARSAGRKGAAVLAMAALLFTAGGVLGEAANVVTDVSGSIEAENVIIVTKDDGKAPDKITINNVAHATEADKAKEADYALKATGDGNGEVIHKIYARKTDAKDNLKVGNDGVISQVTGDDGTTSSAVKTLVLNKDGDNQITMDEKGIKVGKNSTVIASDGVFAGGDTATDAKAALNANGSIKGADGDFTVDADGNVATKGGSIKTNGGVIQTGGGNINTQGGVLRTNGGNINAGNGLIRTTGTVKAGDVQTGTLKTTGNVTIGGALTVNGKLNMDEIYMTKDVLGGDNDVTAKTKVAAGEITAHKTATITKDGSIKESAIDYDENGTSTWAEATDAHKKWNKSTLTVEGSDVKSEVVDSEKNSNLATQTSTQSQSTLTDKDNNTNVSTQTASESSSVVSGKDGKNSYNSYITQNMKKILQKIEDGDGNVLTSTEQTETDITNEAKNKITNKALDVETDAASSIVSKVSNDYGSNTSTQLSHQTTEEMKAEGKTASYLRGAAEEKSQLTDGAKKTTIDTVAGQTNTNITKGKNVSNSLQEADKIASSVTDGTNTTVVNQNAGSLASSITDGPTKFNNSIHWVDGSAQRIEVDDTHFYAETRTAEKAEEALKSGNTVIDIVKDTNTATVSSAVFDDTTNTGISQNAKDINLSAAGGTIASGAKNITNTATVKLSNSAADIENTATTSITDKVGDNTSWKMTDGTVVESVKDASGKTNQTTTTAADTYQFVKDGDNTLAKRTSSTNDNLNITDSNNTYTKITTATGNKQTVTDGTETASTNLTKAASNTLIENGTQSVLDHMAADTSYTVMNENGNGSRRQQTASEILDRVTDGTDTSEVKQTASEVAASAKNISNTATDKITSQIGDGSAVKSEMTAKGITNTAKDGTITNDAKDLVNTASNSITDKVGENVERTMGTKQIQDKVGKTTVTTTDGLTELTNKDRNHKTVMDYANVTKDLNVNGDATVDQKLTVKGDSDLQGNATVGKNLEVKGTSTLKGDVTMESNATVKKDLTVNGKSTFNDKVTIKKNGLDVKDGTTTDTLTVTGTSEFRGKADFKDNVSMGKGLAVAGETKTGTLHVEKDGYVGGDLNVEGNIETHDAVLSADSRQVVTGRQLYQTNERVDRLDNRIKKVGANAAALAALRPGDFNPDDKFSIAAGFGSYRNANAAALGLFYRPNENVLLSLGTSFGDGENMVNAGVSVKFGRGKSMAERRKEMADEVSSMRDEMRSQDERIAELEEMLKKQSELIEKLSKES